MVMSGSQTSKNRGEVWLSATEDMGGVKKLFVRTFGAQTDRGGHGLSREVTKLCR